MPKYTKNITQRDHTENKTFSYKRNGVELDFTLRIDIKQQLKDFLELLKEAQKDVESEITKL